MPTCRLSIASPYECCPISIAGLEPSKNGDTGAAPIKYRKWHRVGDQMSIFSATSMLTVARHAHLTVCSGQTRLASWHATSHISSRGSAPHQVISAPSEKRLPISRHENKP